MLAQTAPSSMDLDPPLNSGTIATDLHANSILKDQGGTHLSEVLQMHLESGHHPTDYPFTKLYRAL